MPFNAGYGMLIHTKSRRTKNIIGGKIMKTKIINIGSTTDVVEILLMVGNLGVKSPNMALNRADAPATKGL